MDEQIPLFMDITSVDDPTVASNFLEMSGGDLQTAVGLYFEHGANLGTTNNTESNANNDEDFQLANQLQNQMYQDTEDNVRQPILPTRDTLVDPEYSMNVNTSVFATNDAQGGMFGRSQRSVFNQTNQHGVIELDSDMSDSDNEDVKLTSTQKRLATIFRPPWDIISKIDLDTAKKQAQIEGKWILINIQDITDFRCQCLNRDFWSSNQIKQLVQANFIFLQYQNDSVSGEIYSNLYPFNNEFPHIAILDPITGERMFTWSSNPEIHKFIEQVVDFLNRFDVKGQNINIAPSSVGLNKENAVLLDDDDDDDDDDGDNDDDDQRNDSESSDVEFENSINNNHDSLLAPSSELSYVSKIHALIAADIPDPSSDTPASAITSIQIKSGIDGQRKVKKFRLDDKVKVIYEYAKSAFAGSLGEHVFTLKTMTGKNLFSLWDTTILAANLSRASIMLEIVDDEAAYNEDEDSHTASSSQ